MSGQLDSEIKYLSGIGPKRAALLEKELNIKTFSDMLHFYPFRYIDRSKIYPINEIEATMSYIQLRGRVTRLSVVGEKGPSKRLVATLTDTTGSIDLVFFQGIKWVKEKLKLHYEYIIFGKPTIFNQTVNIVHPEIDSVVEDNTFYVGNMMGVYSSTEKIRNSGISNKVMARFQAVLLKSHVNYIQETLPQRVLEQKRLMGIREAMRNIHFPENMKQLAAAQMRLKFEELFYLQLSLLKQKGNREAAVRGIPMKKIGESFNRCYQSLPFELTNAQKRVIREIRADMLSGKQLNRLLQGDVGSGKTMVAIFSSLIAADNGYQSCIMAPTEVLANQHYSSALKLLKSTGIQIALLTGSTKSKERAVINQGLLDGSINILFGTHALIEESVQFENLGFVVIDEQHRFGVEQRAKLWSKSNLYLPHVLVMTATPIPRTLAMTLYGDLDLSVIDELPPGRKPIKTIHASESERKRIYDFMKEEIAQGRQIFIVYPLINESETLDYKNLQEGYESIIVEFPAPKYVTAVVHGKQKNEDKAYDMNLFASGKANILVSTSVIEVGVDIPNASVMMIESAERFGLSQLHQLRGRVGRGTDNSYCILMTGYKLTKESKQRIELMCSTQDGFELAEADMRMRGPGDIEGTQQSGLPLELKIANLSKDSQILEEARGVVEQILVEDPMLESADNQILKYKLSKMRVIKEDFSRIS